MRELAHAGPDESNRRTSKWDGVFFWRDLLRSIFPKNTEACTASLTKTSVGAIAHVMRGRNGVSAPTLLRLLRSPIGQRVLDEILDGVEWRDAERRLLEIAEHEQKLEKLKQEIRESDRAASLRR